MLDSNRRADTEPTNLERKVRCQDFRGYAVDETKNPALSNFSNLYFIYNLKIFFEKYMHLINLLRQRQK